MRSSALVLLLLVTAGCSRDASLGDRSPEGSGLPHRDEPPLIRVLLSGADERAQFTLSFVGPYVLSTDDDPDDVLFKGNATGRIAVSAAEDGVAVGGVTIRSRTVRIDAGQLAFGIGRRMYRGVLTVTRADDGLLMPVLELDLETYVLGVVAGEMPASFPAALEAQVIAARTYVLDCELTRRDEPWHVTDDTRSQMFIGLPSGSGAHRFDEATRATRGVVVLYDSRLFRAYYHSTCGGRTAGEDEVFSGSACPPLSGVECGTCDASPRRTWEVDVPVAKLAAAAGMTERISKVVVASRTASGRAATLLITAHEGPRTVGAAELRRALRDPALPSTWIEDIRPVPGGFSFRGRGHGHGVGLCQYGAAGRALRGWSAREIIRDYYPGATVARIY